MSNSLARRGVIYVVTLTCLLMGPTMAWGQSGAGITGEVSDETGAVLPGVTVEASSPALIEKVRTVATDAQGRYNIVDLRPGVYAVTFTLTGFGIVRREGIALPSAFTATVNAQLKVGTVDETVTVSGQSPVVDVQNTNVQKVLTRDVIETLPSARAISSFYAMAIGLSTPANRQDVGGTVADNGTSATTWNSRPGDFQLRVDGMNASNILTTGGGGARGLMLNSAIAQEVTVTMGGQGAQDEVSGVFLNVIPKEGGNTFSGFLFANGTNHSLQSDNISDELRARGLTLVNSVDKIFDLNATFGGPIVKDRLWFFVAARRWGRVKRIGGTYWNATQGIALGAPNSGVSAYTPDLSRPGLKRSVTRDYTGRLTWQASRRHKFSFLHTDEHVCLCNESIDTSFMAPEAAGYLDEYPDNMTQASWTFPATNKVLFEAGAESLIYHYPNLIQPGVKPTDIAITELSTGFLYNANGPPACCQGYGDKVINHYDTRFSMSYISGSHAFKAGFMTQSGKVTFVTKYNGDVQYAFLNGAPVSLTQWATPYYEEERLRLNMGIFAQDKWTLKRLTLNLGLRYDYLNSYVPAQHLVETQFLPARDLAGVEHVPLWKDLSPRVGASYDLFGNGKTAIKGSVGRYVVGEATLMARTANPLITTVNSTTRTWNDANGNYVPDCDLKSPITNGECGALANNAFGQTIVTTRYSDAVTTGFSQRPYNWMVMGELQHELTESVSAHAGYIRRWYGNFAATDNRALTPADFSPYSITAPSDPRLPGGGGGTITGLYDVAPDKFGQVNNLIDHASKYGKQTDHSDFINLSVNARFPNGALLSGGFDTGRTETNRCFVVDSPQELRFCNIVTPWSAQRQFKMFGSYPLPWDFRISGNFQSLSGIQRLADYVATNAQIAPSLGRNLGSGVRGTVLIDLIQPQTQFEGRINQLDIRLAKILRIGRYRMELQFDAYNALNANPIVLMITRYGASWLRPIQILDGRIVKFGAQFTF